MTVREFHAQHRHDPGFADWFQRAKLLSEILALVQLLRLDLFGRKAANGKAETTAEGRPARRWRIGQRRWHPRVEHDTDAARAIPPEQLGAGAAAVGAAG